jgi:hypothetical protein
MTEWLETVLPRAYPIEIAQLMAALIGVPSSIFGTFDALQDYRVVRRLVREGLLHNADDRLFVARRNLKEEFIRLVIHVMFLVNGVVSITHAPPSPGVDVSDERYFQLYFTRTSMAIASILLMVKSLADNRDRRHLRGRS